MDDVVLYAARKAPKFSKYCTNICQLNNFTHSSLSAIQWLCKSHYTKEMIVDEQRSMPLPTFIRTGDSYFKEKEHHLNTMINAKGLPTLFITLSMAESKWIHLT